MTSLPSYALRLCAALLALASLAASCSKEQRAAAPEPTVGITFEAGLAHTRSDIPADGAVHTLDVLVFRTATGALESHVRSAASRVNVEVLKDVEVTCKAVANAPSGAFAGVRTLSGWEGTSALLSQCSPASLIMTGGSTYTFSAPATEQVELRRLPCKVSLETVTPAFLAYAYTDAESHYLGAFLVNAVGSVLYDGTAQTSPWYNPQGRDASLPEAMQALLCADADSTLSGAATISPDIALYCCPNPTDNSSNSLNAPQWSARNTRLVVVLSIAGQLNYYPVTLPAMTGNTEYRITDLRLLGPGSGSPDIPVSRDVIDYTVVVSPWVDDEKDITMY